MLETKSGYKNKTKKLKLVVIIYILNNYFLKMEYNP